MYGQKVRKMWIAVKDARIFCIFFSSIFSEEKLLRKIDKTGVLLMILILNFDGFQNDPHSLTTSHQDYQILVFSNALTIKMSSNKIG